VRITEVETLYLRLPQVEAKESGVQDALIVRVHTDDGIVGIGEVDSAPAVVHAIVHAPFSHSLACGLRELLLGEDPLERERLWRKLYAGSYYFGRRSAVIHALSGIDLALWDIAGKFFGVPVHRLLGATYRDRVRAYASVLFPATPEATKEKAEQLRAMGWTAMKFGWGGFGKDEHTDLALVRALRDGADEQCAVMVDVGMRWDVPTALKMTQRLAEFHLVWLEEPLPADHLEGYATLTRYSPVRIAAGEEATTRYEFRDLIERGGINVAQPDLSRCGGLTEAWRIAVLAEMQGRWVVPHSFSTGILLAASLHFVAALPPEWAPFVEFPMEPSPLVTELVEPPIGLQPDGTVKVPEGVGWGVTLNEQTLERFRVL
jgi:L-alanine-DL-glutamate epimerase-like enolase superfamily enzyme